MITKLAFLVMLAAGTAFADDNTIDLHGTGGFEFVGGDGAFAAGVRGRISLARAFGHGDVRPQVAFGAMVASNELWVDDPRALHGSLGLGLFTYGPELQLGLRFADGGHTDSRVFLSGALLEVDTDDRLDMDYVPGVSSASPFGYRLSLGANWCDAFDDYKVLLPQQVELSWEHDAGSDRFGLTFSYGI